MYESRSSGGVAISSIAKTFATSAAASGKPSFITGTHCSRPSGLTSWRTFTSIISSWILTIGPDPVRGRPRRIPGLPLARGRRTRLRHHRNPSRKCATPSEGRLLSCAGRSDLVGFGDHPTLDDPRETMTTQVSERADWYAMEATEAAVALEVDPLRGLNAAEIQERVTRYGRTVSPRERRSRGSGPFSASTRTSCRSCCWRRRWSTSW